MNKKEGTPDSRWNEKYLLLRTSIWVGFYHQCVIFQVKLKIVDIFDRWKIISGKSGNQIDFVLDSHLISFVQFTWLVIDLLKFESRHIPFFIWIRYLNVKLLTALWNVNIKPHHLSNIQFTGFSPTLILTYFKPNLPNIQFTGFSPTYIDILAYLTQSVKYMIYRF